jgi:hypothetical protein
MSATIKVQCDYCNADLSDSGSRPDYRLVLAAEPIPSTSSVIQSIHVLPPLDRRHHFCGTGCLAAWTHNTITRT